LPTLLATLLALKSLAMVSQGAEKRRTWRKLHLAVDTSTHEIVRAVVSTVSVGDNEVIPTLLNPLRRIIERVSADGAYDTKACHEVLKRKGIKPAIPPRPPPPRKLSTMGRRPPEKCCCRCATSR
jgi:hypothetical protein